MGNECQARQLIKDCDCVCAPLGVCNQEGQIVCFPYRNSELPGICEGTVPSYLGKNKKVAVPMPVPVPVPVPLIVIVTPTAGHMSSILHHLSHKPDPPTYHQLV